MPRLTLAQEGVGVQEVGDNVAIRFVEADLRAVLQTLGRYLPKTLLATNVPGVRVSLETPGPVPRATVLSLIQGLVESHDLSFSEDSTYYRISPAAPKAETDRAAQGAAADGVPIELHVIRLKHARAADVAATVNQLFGGTGAFSGNSGLSTGTLSDELRRQNVPPVGAQGQPGQPGAPGQSSLSGEVVIVPDELTNSLLIRASERDFQVIEEAVNQLDIRPLQVLIEVLIVEARKDRSFSLGADLFLPPQDLDGGTIEAEVLGGGIGDLVIKLMSLGKAKIDAVLRTAQSKGNVEIVSRPVLLASNNTEAHFLVGSQRPFVQVSRSLPTDAPSRDQVVQYRDVGTKLMVRPTINQDGYVSLVIQQEINQATSEVAFDAPVISTREASTRVLVRDGQTIVLGGLSDQQVEHTQSGVPILSSIPLIGGLFGSADRRKSEIELFLFLTPRIIRDDQDVDDLTQPILPPSDQKHGEQTPPAE
ncbi:MAG TPA: secretin N-terminal domain-containing protein [Gemmatimonadales bacterium]|nr:secretin N-terminal domain-containing protein [Gemmatimonadales bacterium]